MIFLYIDDSQLTINSYDHVILTGLIVKNPEKIYEEVSKIRKKNGIKIYEEFKSASSLVRNENEFLEDVIHAISSYTETCLCVIKKSLDKQSAACLIVEQVLQYCHETQIEEIYLLFDKGIIDGGFLTKIRELDNNGLIIGFQSLDSKYDYGIQIADWFVTQFKTYLAFCIKDQDRVILTDDINGKTETSYRFFSSMAIRYYWWGDVLNGEMGTDFENGQSPFKYIVGKGIKVDSSPEIEQLIKKITQVYMGCIH